ncbi:hypothetical protein [Nocardia sp.]|uniref:hypothetical protein n=1 Tax=Nocardia sp. TaxID=1821 RepID=UPI002622BBDC|nr:hypothetical protein [Nocardia sp.]
MRIPGYAMEVTGQRQRAAGTSGAALGAPARCHQREQQVRGLDVCVAPVPM